MAGCWHNECLANASEGTDLLAFRSYALGSGELEEHLLDGVEGVAGGLGLVGVGDAVGEAGGDELEPGLFEGSGGSADLGDDVFALAAVVEHAFDAGELAADTVQALADVVDDLFR